MPTVKEIFAPLRYLVDISKKSSALDPELDVLTKKIQDFIDKQT